MLVVANDIGQNDIPTSAALWLPAPAFGLPVTIRLNESDSQRPVPLDPGLASFRRRIGGDMALAGMAAEAGFGPIVVKFLAAGLYTVTVDKRPADASDTNPRDVLQDSADQGLGANRPLAMSGMSGAMSTL